MNKFTTKAVPHPGERARNEVIPKNMPVTKAAELMGVGRPALSNFLNGKASLSAEMAGRFEKAFGVPRQNLLEMQAQYDAFKAAQQAAPIGAQAYVPPFLSIKANDIEAWATHNIAARSRFAVLLRTLVHSTGSGLTEVDFPGNDDAERAGWDGTVNAAVGTSWVPEERSGWEFGTNEDPKAKAEKDYAKSILATNAVERAEMVFVFVTPRRWAGKRTWIAEKQAEGAWKDVRAYDSSDLEQWMEQSLPAQTWFANETKVPAQDVRSLDKCWADWANVAVPPLPATLFSSAINEAKEKLEARLSKSPSGPIIIAADSSDEALAFVAQCFSSEAATGLERFRYQILVFDKAGVLPRLAEGARSFIPVVHSREVEIELAPYAKLMHSIVVYPRNSINTEPDIVLEPVSFETFDTALKGLGKNRDEIRNLANSSGRSLTVLRRRLATVEAVRTPLWAMQQQAPEKLVPFMLVGAWHFLNETDKTGLSLLAHDRSADDLERDCQNLLQLADAPLWSIGTYRGVVSKIDLLYTIARYVTRADLTRYFEVAQMVLGEDDPSLDLAEDQRWAARIHGKTREFSVTFRQGISETLVLLAVHGGSFKERVGFDTEARATSLVRELLTPLTTRLLEANDKDLPLYAEAAPLEFMSIIEGDLKSSNPAVFGVLRPATSGLFSSPSRTGLLWALEGLAWNPVTLPRAALILARLAQIEINDNWTNKPEHSLKAIFRAWMPQTAANYEERLGLMNTLFRKFPDVAWRVCVAQFGEHSQIGDYSHKPLWRLDGHGYGEPITSPEQIQKFVDEMVELSLTRETYSLTMLCDLVDRLHALSNVEQDRVWALIETWAKEASDNDKVVMREKIRVRTLSRRAKTRAMKTKEPAYVATAAKGIYAALEPGNALDKHAWLFSNMWIEESADELEDRDDSDYQQRDRRISNLRTQALKEIHHQSGIEGILDAASRGNTSWIVGELSAKDVLGKLDLLKLVTAAFQKMKIGDAATHASSGLIRGVLGSITDDAEREAFIKSAISELGADNAVPILLLAPFTEATWAMISSLGDTEEERYWQEVVPTWLGDDTHVVRKAVDMLVNVRRPRAAFSLVRSRPSVLSTQDLFNVLTKMAWDSADRPGEYPLEHYYVENAFKCIDATTELSLEQKAVLEFAYIDALVRSWERNAKSSIPNLELYIETHPEFFVQAICWTYKRRDGAIDPPEFAVEAERKQAMAERGYKLLDALKRIPGSMEDGTIDMKRLGQWIATVRQSCSALSRSEIADIVIGQLLSSAPIGSDGVWPCEPVRTVMEDIQSEEIMRGAHTGVYNSRGAHMRGPGGGQERTLADKYRKWAQQIRTSSPFVASELLMSLARTYDAEAAREDTEERINQRLG